MRYGVPSRLVADNATEFGAQVIKELTRLSGVTLRFVALYAPHQNGIAERRHRDLNAAMKTFLQT